MCKGPGAQQSPLPLKPARLLPLCRSHLQETGQSTLTGTGPALSCCSHCHTGIQAEGLALDVPAPGGRRLRAIGYGQPARPHPVRWGGEASPHPAWIGPRLGPPLLRARVWGRRQGSLGLTGTLGGCPAASEADTRRDSQGWSGTFQGFLILLYAPKLQVYFFVTVMRLL